jgi:hypothetical protein
MSTTNDPVSLVAFIATNVISVYFLYMVIKGVYYHLTQSKDDDL